jgi:hypothetical protein
MEILASSIGRQLLTVGCDHQDGEGISASSWRMLAFPLSPEWHFVCALRNYFPGAGPNSGIKVLSY